MGALHGAILSCVSAGSKIVASRELFGATYALLQTIFDSLGVETVFVDSLDLDAIGSAITSIRPRAVLVETISNPLLNVANLPAITELAHAVGATVICDNTFATPVLVNPAKFGVDLTMHSTTKYLGGHGDVLGACWTGYLSSTGVYGDTGGAWADESAPVGHGRRSARSDADGEWLARGARVFRLPGIYGPGRSALDRVREGKAHRIALPGQVFSRVHVDDIAAGVIAGYGIWFYWQKRTIFAFYEITFEPFIVLAVVLVIGLLLRPALSPECPPNERQLRVVGIAAYLVVHVALFTYFYPIHAAEVIPYKEWYLRMWFPSWI